MSRRNRAARAEQQRRKQKQPFKQSRPSPFQE
jgi:hypothetical protein